MTRLRFEDDAKSMTLQILHNALDFDSASLTGFWGAVRASW